MEEELIRYGLSEKEAKLYLLCLKTGEVTANRLIELSGFPRGTVYDILDKLRLRGLISSVIREKTLVFAANDPDVLIKELEEKKTDIEKVVPKLRGLSNTISKKPSIEVFEGFAGVKKVLDEVLNSCKEVIVMGNEQDARDLARHHSENFRQRRLEKKIKIKNLLEGSKIARELKDDKYSQVRHLEQLENSREVLIIYNDTTAHMIMTEPITIIKINSKEHTDNQRLMFENLWKAARK